jgi:multimeric flavodoxin WrbA
MTENVHFCPGFHETINNMENFGISMLWFWLCYINGLEDRNIKTAICYFSGTGNGFDLALRLNECITNSAIFNIPNIDVNSLHDYEKIVIVSPIYCFGVPAAIKTFLQKLSNYNHKTFYGILHSGGFSGNAKYYFKTVFDKNGLYCNNIYKLPLEKSEKTIELTAKKIIANNKGNVKRNLFSFCDKIHEKMTADVHKGEYWE